MTFVGLLAHNVWRRRLRAVVTATAVAIGVTAVMALGVLTSSLRETAVAVLQIGKADFSVSQEGASDVLYSTMSKQEIDAIRATKGVKSAIGTFVRTGRINAAHPFFIQIGLDPRDEAGYGVQVVDGRSFTANATDEMMLGWRAAKDFGVGVGDRFKLEERTFRVVGIFSTNNPIGDGGGMFPVTELQAWHTLPGRVHAGVRESAAPRQRVGGSSRGRESEPPARDDRDRVGIRPGRPQPRADHGGQRRRIDPGAVHRCDRCDEHLAVVVLRAHPRVRVAAGDGLEPPAPVRPRARRGAPRQLRRGRGGRR